MSTLLLLPAPVKRLTDAGHAVKRIAGQVVQAITTATLSQWIENWKIHVRSISL